MINLSNVGRIFYGTAIVAMGFHAILYHDFPYMLIPPNHSWIPGLTLLAYISGTILVLAGACIVFGKQTSLIAFLLGIALLLIFCFYFIPYEFTATSKYLHPIEWDNPEKELDLSLGAFIIAGSFSNKNGNALASFLPKLARLATLIFAITIVTFGIDHFLYAKGVSEYIPSWISQRMFWTYLAGTALFGSGIAIILKIKTRLIATLLGSMILTWFIILHIPKVVASSFSDVGGEVTSAFLALAYSGIAFVIAGVER